MLHTVCSTQEVIGAVLIRHGTHIELRLAPMQGLTACLPPAAGSDVYLLVHTSATRLMYLTVDLLFQLMACSVTVHIFFTHLMNIIVVQRKTKVHLMCDCCRAGRG